MRAPVPGQDADVGADVADLDPPRSARGLHVGVDDAEVLGDPCHRGDDRQEVGQGRAGPPGAVRALRVETVEGLEDADLLAAGLEEADEAVGHLQGKGAAHGDVVVALPAPPPPSAGRARCGGCAGPTDRGPDRARDPVSRSQGPHLGQLGLHVHEPPVDALLAARSSAWEPSSTMRPLSRTRRRSAFFRVDSRWAMGEGGAIGDEPFQSLLDLVLGLRVPPSSWPRRGSGSGGCR